MRLLLVVALVACTKQAPSPPPVRSQTELVQQVTAFAALVHGGTLPAVDDTRFVRPPTEAELAWLGDRKQPVKPRVEAGLDLFDQIRTVIHAYVDHDVAIGKDSPESIAWMLAMVAGYAVFVDVLIDEFWPTVVHDPTRRKGLGQVEQGAVGMLQGGLISVGARRIDVATRLHILDVWHAHAASYRKVWSADDCTKLAGAVAMIRLTEKNHAIDEGLARLAKDLENCHGVVP